MYQTDRKEAKENKRITNGTKMNSGVIKKFQPKNKSSCIPVRLLNQLTFHNNKVNGKAKRSQYKTVKEVVRKKIFPEKILLRLVGISVERKNKSVPSFSVFWAISSIPPQNNQESGLIIKVQTKNGISIKLGKTRPKKSLVLFTAGPTYLLIKLPLVCSHSPLKSQLLDMANKNTKITICKNKHIQVFFLRSNLFK